MQGNGYLSKQEAKHFVNKYLRQSKGIEYISDEKFEQWFRSIDKDGDGHIEMVEMANYLKLLAHKIQKNDYFLQTDKYGPAYN